MLSIDIANLFIVRHGKDLRPTNLSLNKLVYYAQAESLREGAGPLFSDNIEAWDYGPVEPAVYRAFKSWGRSVITEPTAQVAASPAEMSHASSIVDAVADKFGALSAFDLVEFSHREGGAWHNCYKPGRNAVISPEDIASSSDCQGELSFAGTLLEGIRSAEEKWPNTLRMLEDA